MIGTTCGCCGWSRRRMVSATLAGALLGGCDAPEVRRAAAVVVSPEQEAELGAQAFRQIRHEIPRLRNRRSQARVQEIASRIVPASGSSIPLAEWEVEVFDSDEINAFALPGGHIGVYRGILELAGDDDAQIATVIGHEVGHVTARHAAQRLGTQAGADALTKLLALGIEAYLGGGGSTAMALLGAGAQFGVALPFSRGQESEADALGLRSMAKAGYDPTRAVTFWQKMAASGGPNPPELLSTHPADSTRIAQIERMLPEVLPLYRATRAG